MAVTAIETTYAGHQFRSRLEARWAVFFNYLGIEWQYEPQGFVICGPAGRWTYLPDFYLPKLDVWVEVKGNASALDWEMLATAADGWAVSSLPPSRRAYSGNCTSSSEAVCDCGGCGSAILVLGNIPSEAKQAAAWSRPWAHEVSRVDHYLVVNKKATQIIGAWFNDNGALKVERHREYGIFDGTGSTSVEWFRGAPPTNIDQAAYVQVLGTSFEKVRAAYTAARKARFEHGRQG